MKFTRKNIVPSQKEYMMELRLVQGLSNLEIAAKMNISEVTVYNHIGPQPAIMTKIRRELGWKHRHERLAAQKTIAAHLHLEKVARDEAKHLKEEALQRAAEEARLLEEARIREEAEKRRIHEERVAAIQEAISRKEAMEAAMTEVAQKFEQLRLDFVAISAEVSEGEEYLRSCGEQLSV